MIPSAPKFRKVILLLKDKFSKDIDIPSSVRIEHEDCAIAGRAYGLCDSA